MLPVPIIPKIMLAYWAQAYSALTTQVLKESLRLYPTAGIGFSQDAPPGCVLSRYRIPPGTTLWVSFYETLHATVCDSATQRLSATYVEQKITQKWCQMYTLCQLVIYYQSVRAMDIA